MSPGDVMNNFWDGSKCVSVTFIVCICAALGGAIILVLIGVILWQNAQRRRYSQHGGSSEM